MSYLSVKFVSFLKSRLIFNAFFCFWMFLTNFQYISRKHISKSKRFFNVKSSTYYFHMETGILTDFHICISVPLTLKQIFCKTKTFFKKLEYRFLVETTKIENKNFRSKLLCQKPMLRQIHSFFYKNNFIRTRASYLTKS